MEILESFAKLKHQEPVALTIGVFDGVHLGHQKLLSVLKSQKLHTVLITFKNHPKAWIQKTPTQNIHPFPQRVEYLAEQGIDTLYALPFDESIRNLTAQEFLQKCASLFNLRTLILGHDTALGSDRVTDLQGIRVAPYLLDGEIVSSQKIRDKIKQGDFATASRMLGKPYELKLEPERISGNTIEANDLALPPPGVWRGVLNGVETTLTVTPSGSLEFQENLESTSPSQLVLSHRL